MASGLAVLASLVLPWKRLRSRSMPNHDPRHVFLTDVVLALTAGGVPALARCQAGWGVFTIRRPGVHLPSVTTRERYRSYARPCGNISSNLKHYEGGCSRCGPY